MYATKNLYNLAGQNEGFMFNRCLIMLTAVLSISCAQVTTRYKPTPEALGPNPATLRVSKIDKTIIHSSLSILRQEVNCKHPGETTTRITPIGYTEIHGIKGGSLKPPYSVQIPSNQT